MKGDDFLKVKIESILKITVIVFSAILAIQVIFFLKTSISLHGIKKQVKHIKNEIILVTNDINTTRNKIADIENR